MRHWKPSLAPVKRIEIEACIEINVGFVDSELLVDSACNLGGLKAVDAFLTNSLK